VLSALSLFELEELSSSGALQGGMSVKAAAIRSAIEGGVDRVHVVSGLSPDALLGELYTTQGTGTLVTREKLSAPAGPSPLLDAPQR
jgi:acetylglutamate kinase